MFCNMDVDDNLADPRNFRKMACACDSKPTPPLVAFGCRCELCGSTCRECPGFGFASPPEKNCQQILTRVRSIIRRRFRKVGHPPGYVRLTRNEIRVLTRKRRAETRGHWIHEYVDPGPPVRVFDVIVVVDRRIR